MLDGLRCRVRQIIPALGKRRHFVNHHLRPFAEGLPGAMLLHSNDRRGWAIGGGAAFVTLVGYSVTRTVGLPQSNGDIGNWLEPIGLASIFIEAVVTAVALYALATMKSVVGVVRRTESR